MKDEEMVDCEEEPLSVLLMIRDVRDDSGRPVLQRGETVRGTMSANLLGFPGLAGRAHWINHADDVHIIPGDAAQDIDNLMERAERSGKDVSHYIVRRRGVGLKGKNIRLLKLFPGVGEPAAVTVNIAELLRNLGLSRAQLLMQMRRPEGLEPYDLIFQNEDGQWTTVR